MKSVMLRWIYEGYSFWNLACHACGSCEGWHTSFCRWRSNSCIAIATCRRCGAEQFLKKYRQSGKDTQSVAQWEYEVLRHLDGGSRNEPCFLAPRAYHFAEETSALSMEYLQGESVDERIRRARDRQGFDDCLHMSATWLRGLHAAPPISISDKTGNGHTAMLRRLETDCASLADRNAMVAQALMRMRCHLNEIDGLAVKRVLLHGDFKPSNLIWTAGGVYGIDIGLRFKNLKVMDVAQFIANVCLNRGSIPAIASEHDLALTLDVFLEAYGDNSQPTLKLTVWWLLYFLLSRWQEDLEGWKPSMVVNRNYAAALADATAFCESSDDWRLH